MSFQSHLRSDALPFQATSIPVSSLAMLLSIHETKRSYTMLILSVPTILGSAGFRPWVRTDCGSQSISVFGFTYSLKV